MRKRGKGYKKPCALGEKVTFQPRMSTSWEYGDVSPARYPNPGRKRKSTKSSHPAGKKKKEKEEIQNMTPIGLEAFKKNDATYLGDMPDDHDPPLVEVVQQGVSFPQPSEKETQAAVEEVMNELNGMVDQATQTCPAPPPPPPEDDNEGLKRMVRMATIFQSPAFQNPRPRPPPSSVDYMVCPCHEVRLEERQSGTMSNVPSNLVCCFVLKRKPSTI